MFRITGPHDAVVEIDPNDEKTAITKIRLLGFKVFVAHKRQSHPYPHVRKYVPATSAHDLKEQGYVPHPKGGATLVQIVNADGETVGAGTAYCSDEDNFDRKLGTRIALGRALKEMSK